MVSGVRYGTTASCPLLAAHSLTFCQVVIQFGPSFDKTCQEQLALVPNDRFAFCHLSLSLFQFIVFLLFTMFVWELLTTSKGYP